MTAKAYGYVRVSSEHQADSGLGLAAQRQRIITHCRSARLRLVRICADKAVSGRRPFVERPSGRAMDLDLARGDHLVIAKLDRAFRSLRDCATMLERWRERGIYVHLLDVGVNTDTPVGELVIGIMASVAQWESRRIGERITETKAILRQSGQATNAAARLGYRLVRRRLLKPDQTQRAVGRQIRAMRDRGMPWGDIVKALNERRVARPVVPNPRSHRGSRAWNQQAVRRAYHAAATQWRLSEREMHKTGYLPRANPV